jgi:hypothetical protein
MGFVAARTGSGNYVVSATGRNSLARDVERAADLVERPRGLERVSFFDRSEGRSLAPTLVGEELARFEPVGVAPGLVAGDVPPELSDCHPVLADQLAGRLGQLSLTLRPAARVAGDAPLSAA